MCLGRKGREEVGEPWGPDLLRTWKQRSGHVDFILRENRRQCRVLSKGVTSLKRWPCPPCRGQQGADWGVGEGETVTPPRVELPRFCMAVKGFLDGSDVGGREESRTPASGSKDLE